MVQETPLVFLAHKNSRRYLTVIPGSFAFPDLMHLGFSVTACNGTLAYERAFHPALVPQLSNLLGPGAISIELRGLLATYQRENLHDINAHIIRDDPKLLDWQRPASTFIAARRRAYLALAPGLGKSLCALRAVEAAGYRHICIVAPLSLLDNWRKEIAKWLPATRVYKVYSGEILKSGPAGAGRAIFLMSYESFQVWFPKLRGRVGFDLVMFDEAILLKNRDTERYKGTAKQKREDPKRRRAPIDGVDDLLATYKNSLWLLSGGPTSRFLDDMWAQLRLLDRKRFSSYWQFASHYCVIEPSKWSSKVVADRPGAVQALQGDIADIYYSKTQDEVADLPSFIFDAYEVEMGEEQAAIYTRMEKEFMAELPSGDTIIAGNLLTQMLRLVQIASNASLLEDEGVVPISSEKWDYVESLLEFVQGPMLIWTSFIRTASLLGKRFGHRRIGTLTGAVEKADRQRIVDDFQNGGLDILIAHPAVGKFGHTLTKARTAIYVEKSYNGDDRYQSLYRIRRIGTKEAPRVIDLLSLNDGKRTVDHAIHDILRRRHDRNVAIITGGELRKAWAGELETQ